MKPSLALTSEAQPSRPRYASLACSPETSAQVDQKVIALVKREYQKAEELLKSHMQALNALADLGADVVLGSHPHVIGPMTWLEGEEGNRTLVAYSLGNFVVNHDAPSAKNQLEGMLSCDFVREEEDGEVGIENVVWTPLVMHTDGSTFAVYPLKDYTDELAEKNPVLAELDDPIAWLSDTSAKVVNSLGDDFEIDA